MGKSNKPTLYILASSKNYGVDNPEFLDTDIFFGTYQNYYDSGYEASEDTFVSWNSNDVAPANRVYNHPELQDRHVQMLDQLVGSLDPDAVDKYVDTIYDNLEVMYENANLYQDKWDIDNIISRVESLSEISSLQKNVNIIQHIRYSMFGDAKVSKETAKPYLDNLSAVYGVSENTLLNSGLIMKTEGEGKKAKRLYGKAGYNVEVLPTYGYAEVNENLKLISGDPNAKVIIMDHLGDPEAKMLGMYPSEWGDIKNDFEGSGVDFSNDIFMGACGAGGCAVNYAGSPESVDLLKDEDPEKIKNFMHASIESVIKETEQIAHLSKGTLAERLGRMVRGDSPYDKDLSFPFEEQYVLHTLGGSGKSVDLQDVFDQVMMEYSYAPFDNEIQLSETIQPSSQIQGIQYAFPGSTVYATRKSWVTTLPSSMVPEGEDINTQIANMLFSFDPKETYNSNSEWLAQNYPLYEEFEPGETTTDIQSQIAEILGMDELNPENLMEFYEDYDRTAGELLWEDDNPIGAWVRDITGR